MPTETISVAQSCVCCLNIQPTIGHDLILDEALCRMSEITSPKKINQKNIA